MHLVAAAKADDTDGFLASFTDDARSTWSQWLSSRVLLAKATADFTQALDQKFPTASAASKKEEMPRNDGDLHHLLRRISQMQVEAKTPSGKDQFALKIRTSSLDMMGGPVVTEEIFTAVKEGDGWKLVPPRLSDFRKSTNVAAAWTALVSERARDVRADVYSSREAAEAAVAGGEETILRAFASPRKPRAKATTAGATTSPSSTTHSTTSAMRGLR